MRIAVSSSPFGKPLEAGTLTQLEWIERCGSVLGVDGVLPDVAHFPRTDGEYAAQVRKVTIDLGMVPLGLDCGALLGAEDADRTASTFALALALGGALVRTTLPAPGAVPPAAFVAAVAAAKRVSRAAKAANVTVVVAAAPGTLGSDEAGVKHLLKDVDSAWLRAVPSAPAVAPGPRDRYPAFQASTADDPAAVAAKAGRAWLILDAEPGEQPWERLAAAIDALRIADARLRLAG